MALKDHGKQAVNSETRDTKRLLVARSAVRAVPMNIVNVGILSALFVGFVDPVMHAGWAALICVSAILRLATMWRAIRADGPPSDRALHAYTFMSFVVGLGWGLTPFLLTAGTPVLIHVAVSMTIAGMVFGAAITSASEHRVVLAYTAPALGLWALWIGMTGLNLQAGVVIVLLVGFFAIMNVLTRTYAGTLTDAFQAHAALKESRRHTEAQAAAMSRLADHNDKAARRAEDQARSNAAVLANMSHELRSPLNGVLGMSQLLQESELSPDQRAFVDRVVESGELLNARLTDVLDVARIEAGRLELALEDVTARSVAGMLRKSFASKARAKGLAFEVQVSGDAEQALRGDGERLRQLASIYLKNALQFTSEGGIVAHVCTIPDAGGRSKLRVEVRDTGVGVPVSARDALFDAMSAEKMDRNIREAGTGLGLHLAKRLAGLMDGSVGYDPAETGSGSIFWLEVRLRNSHKHDRYADGEQLTLDTRRLRMLVAENDPARRSVMLGYLKSFNCAVTCVPSREELVENLSAAAYDAVVVGLSLSDDAAEDVVKVIQALPSTAAVTPIVRLAESLEEPVVDASTEVLVRAPLAAEPLLEALHLAVNADPGATASLRRIA